MDFYAISGRIKKAKGVHMSKIFILTQPYSTQTQAMYQWLTPQGEASSQALARKLRGEVAHVFYAPPTDDPFRPILQATEQAAHIFSGELDPGRGPAKADWLQANMGSTQQLVEKWRADFKEAVTAGLRKIPRAAKAVIAITDRASFGPVYEALTGEAPTPDLLEKPTTIVLETATDWKQAGRFRVRSSITL
jgi:hypothetical protein